MVTMSTCVNKIDQRQLSGLSLVTQYLSLLFTFLLPKTGRSCTHSLLGRVPGLCPARPHAEGHAFLKSQL